MKYELDIARKVIDKFEDEWRLPEPILDELERLFDEQLATDPSTHLRRASDPSKGGEYHCDVVGEGARRLVYSFIFRVHFQAGQNTLVIYDGFLKPLTLAGFS